MAEYFPGRKTTPVFSQTGELKSSFPCSFGERSRRVRGSHVESVASSQESLHRLGEESPVWMVVTVGAETPAWSGEESPAGESPAGTGEGSPAGVSPAGTGEESPARTAVISCEATTAWTQPVIFAAPWHGLA